MIPTRSVENKMARLFSENKPFSEHLSKWEDPALPDKYDHNAFAYSAQPTEEEFRAAGGGSGLSSISPCGRGRHAAPHV